MLHSVIKCAIVCVFCAGWIRYAERVLGSLVTPHICTARSPQQIMGSMVKDFFARQQVRGFYGSLENLFCFACNI